MVQEITGGRGAYAAIECVGGELFAKVRCRRCPCRGHLSSCSTAYACMVAGSSVVVECTEAATFRHTRRHAPMVNKLCCLKANCAGRRVPWCVQVAAAVRSGGTCIIYGELRCLLLLPAFLD